MDNIKIYIANRGQGKTKWLVERIIEHETEGKEMYYVGSEASYDGVVYLYQSTMHKRCPLLHMSDKTPDWNTKDECFFTDNLMFVFSKGKPNSINMIKDAPCKSAGQVLKGARKHSDGKRDKVPDFVCGEFKKRHNVWDINVSSNTNGHPAVFPEQLAKDHILSWSNEGDIVLDCFMGSGTTAKMALLNNRNFIGFEVSKEYCDIANERIAKVGV